MSLSGSGRVTSTYNAVSDGASDALPVFRRGACLGRYVILAPLGSGGMGHVFDAYDPELDRKVAIKVLHGDRLTSQDRPHAERRLRREARAAARLNHPNVVAVHDVGRVGQRFFVAMERIEGQTLDAWCRERSRAPREILDAIAQAGRGLAAAHRVGLMHRDFKPSNVMVRADGRVQVVDFGLARALGHGEPTRPGRTADAGTDTGLTASLTATGQALGTPAYMAPEQLADGTVDARADQYSFCVVLYEALHGHRPPVAGDERGELPIDPKLPGRVRRVLRRGLAVDPATRFADMDELLAALGRGSRRRTITAAILAIAALSLSGALVLGPRTERPCQDAARHLDGIWDAATKAALRDAFLAGGVPSAELLWSATAAELDAYADGWVALHTETCEATQVRGEQSAELLDLRMSCLDTRLHELRSLTRRLLRGDGDLFRRALDAATGLTRLAGCRDRDTLLALAPPPAPLAADVDRWRKRMAEIRTAHLFGRFNEALTQAEEVIAATADVPYPPLRAEAHGIMGFALGRFRRVPEMREHLLAAVDLALASGHRELLADASTLLIIAAFLEGDLENARLWGRLAKGAIAHLGGREDLEARRLRYVGVALNSNGHHDEAIEHFRTALTVDPDVTRLDLAQTLLNITLAHTRSGRIDEAAEPLERALALSEEAYGYDHPLFAQPLSIRGHLLASQGRHGEAVETFRRVLAIYEVHFGPDYSELVYPHHSLGTSLLELGRRQEALLHLEESLRIVELGAASPVDAAEVRFSLARALAAERSARALDLARAARDAYADAGPERSAELARVEDWLRRHEDGPR